MSPPLVSLLVPTRDRRAYLPRVFDYLRRQDHPADQLEMIILDDGRDPVQDLIPDDPRIRYAHLGPRVPLGTKRNLLCEAARGDILLHMDDDDWQAPTRVSAAVHALEHTGHPVAGQTVVAVWDLDTGHLHTTPSAGDRHAMAGTLAYTRDFWTTHPWAADPRDEERQFLRNFVAPVAQLPGPPWHTLVALVHGDNTRLRTAPLPRAPGHIEDWLPPEDIAFYQAIDRSGW